MTEDYKSGLIDNLTIMKSINIEWIKKHLEELEKYYEKVINGFQEKINEKT